MAVAWTESRSDVFMDNAPAVAFMKDAAGRYVYANRAFERFFRTPLPGILGKTDFDIRDADLAELLRAHDQAVLTENRTMEFVEVVPDPDGQPHEWEVLKFPFSTADGRRFVCGMAVDITERRRAERRLALQYALTEVMAESTSLEAAIPRVLQCMTEAMGFFVSELWLVDSAADRLVCCGTWPASTPELAAFKATSTSTQFGRGEWLPGRVWEDDEPVVIPDVTADPRFVRVNQAAAAGLRGCFAFPLRHGSGVLGVMASFSRDVLHADADFPRLVEAVSHRIGLFIQRQRAEQRVRELQARAEERTRLGDIGAIAARIVHDVGNPLAGLKMQAQSVLRRASRQSLPATIVAPLEEILSTVKRLERLVTSFTDFTRQQRLDLHAIEVRHFMQNVVDFWRPVAVDRGIALDLEVAAGVGPLRADAEKLRRVLDNLLKNAVEAIERGPGRIFVQVGTDAPDRVRISVEDTGPGIPDGVEAFRLFETTKPKGSGIGLSIAQELVLAHKGTMGYQRLAPHGTLVYVDLPSQR